MKNLPLVNVSTIVYFGAERILGIGNY